MRARREIQTKNIILAILAAAIIVTLFHIESVRADAAARNATAKEVFHELNEIRAEHGFEELEWDESLTGCATVRSYEIPGCFSHTRPDGRAWYTVDKGVMYGENLLRSRVRRDADAIMDMWMNSASHRELILDGSYETVGVATYSYKGIDYWVMEFGY